MTRHHAFELDMKRTQDANMVWMMGELDLSKVAELRRALDPYIADTQRKLIINLKQLEYIDSTGIGVIVSVIKARDVLKAPFTVEDIPAKIQRLFDITGITPFLRSPDTETAPKSTTH